MYAGSRVRHSVAIYGQCLLFCDQSLREKAWRMHILWWAEYVRALKGLVPPRACHSGEIALAGSRRLRSALAAAPVLFAHAVVTEAENRTSATP